ncbi:MAG: NAD(P)-binding protein, partial [Pseudomonadota bacterium]
MSWMREETRRGEGPSRRAVVGGLAAGTAALGLGGAALMPRLGREQAVIIGGGPAGAAAAIAWRQHWPDASVLLIERDPTRLGLLVQGAQLSPVPMGPDLSTLRRAEVEVAVDEAVGL